MNNHNLLAAPLTRVVKRAFHLLGVDIVRLKNVPAHTFAGLKNRNIRTVIDCGANKGQFARQISGFFPEAKLHCFEPLETPFQELSALAQTQGDRVHCYNVALGDEPGSVVMHHHVDHDTSSSLLPRTGHQAALFPFTERQAEIVVPVTTLDVALAPCLDAMAPGILLKLDVQGYEDRVLKGAQHVLNKADWCLLEVCVDPLYSEQASFARLVAMLDAHDLDYVGNLDQTYGDDGRIMWLDALFKRR